MLITCPECQHNVSDKAVACPHCGYPINSASAPLKRNTSRSRKFQRLPNGFGSIKHLSGKRRNPYAVYPPTIEWTATGPKSRPAIGYFQTYNDAYAALAEYNRLGISIEQKLTTFEQIYEMFITEYKTKNPSNSALNGYANAYKRCAELKDRSFAELRKQDFQKIFDDNDHYSKSIISNLKKLFNQMYKVAIENDIVDRNYSSNTITGGKEIEKGVPFTLEEVKMIWEMKDDPIAQITLMMIYSGYRAGELEVIEIRKDRFVGGLKTKTGKERIVPIHDVLRNFNYRTLLSNYKYDQFKSEFYDMLNNLGIGYDKRGTKHTPHDCRHTFSWLADRCGVDELSKHLIMGHSLGTDVERNTYGHRTFEELQREINKISVQ